MIPDAELQDLADCQMPIHGQLSEVARELIACRAECAELNRRLREVERGLLE